MPSVAAIHPTTGAAMPTHLTTTFDQKQRRAYGVCEGVLSYPDLEEWMISVVKNGAQGFPALIDATRCRLALDPAGYRRFARLVRELARQWRFGPAAVIVADEKTQAGVHTLGLMMHSTCPLRVFWTQAEAELWLENEARERVVA